MTRGRDGKADTVFVQEGVETVLREGQSVPGEYRCQHSSKGWTGRFINPACWLWSSVIVEQMTSERPKSQKLVLCSAVSVLLVTPPAVSTLSPIPNQVPLFQSSLCWSWLNLHSVTREELWILGLHCYYTPHTPITELMVHYHHYCNYLFLWENQLLRKNVSFTFTQLHSMWRKVKYEARVCGV